MQRCDASQKLPRRGSDDFGSVKLFSPKSIPAFLKDVPLKQSNKKYTNFSHLNKTDKNSYLSFVITVIVYRTKLLSLTGNAKRKLVSGVKASLSYACSCERSNVHLRFWKVCSANSFMPMAFI